VRLSAKLAEIPGVWTTNGPAIANRLTQAAHRAIDWVHVPVPIDRDDPAYFAPLAGLALAPDTELHLGLIHHADGVDGAARRAATAAAYAPGFGVGTECGFGRRDPDTVLSLLRLHAAVAQRLT
jgi:hypothetical protein